MNDLDRELEVSQRGKKTNAVVCKIARCSCDRNWTISNPPFTHLSQLLSNWSLSKDKINLIVWIARIGGIFGILLGIWMLFFARV